MTQKGLRQAAQDALDLAGKLLCAATAACHYASYEDAGGNDDHTEGGENAPSSGEARSEAAGTVCAASFKWLTPQNAPRDPAALAAYTLSICISSPRRTSAVCVPKPRGRRGTGLRRPRHAWRTY
jgi:hypothetical protein